MSSMNLKGKAVWLLVLCLLNGVIGRATAQESGLQSLPRLIVLTDISAFVHEEGEPDDSQSMVRLMLYTNELDIEGLVATSNMRHGQRTRPELIEKVVEAYGKVRDNLLLHDRNYPSAEFLADKIKQGQPVAGPNVPVEQSVGEGKDTEGSDWIIAVVDKVDPRPVWFAIWGGSADLAQALWKVRSTRTPDKVKEFVDKLRVHFVYDQDATGPWIRSEFPGLYSIFRHHGIRGMYRGGDTTLVRSQWVEANIRNDHGPLGRLYTHYRGGDIWSRKLGRVYGIKEGDTPSFLYLLSNGLNIPGRPDLGNWSGRFRRDSTHHYLWVEAVDKLPGYETDPDPRMAAIYRWRPAWQADFAARLDWCVKSYAEANHSPQASNGLKKESVVKSGKTINLSASKFTDPDSDRIHYKWFFYPEEGTYDGIFPVLNAEGAKASFVAPRVSSPRTLHVILEVSDNGQPSLTAYERFIVTVRP